MNNTRLILVGAVVLVVLIAGFLLLSNKSGTQTETQNTNPSTSTNVSEENESMQATVSVTQSGFEPSTITIKKGTNVIWTNNSGDVANVSSDNHPTHLRFPFLNLGSFENSQTVSVVFEETGTFSYHDHLNPARTATVIVE